MSENVKSYVKDNIGYIVMNRPEAMNALNTEVLKELMDVINDIAANDEAKVVIVTGEGKAFIAGADISQMKDLEGYEGRGFTMIGQRVFTALRDMEKPVIAAVNGFALGGGCELAMSCDVILASEKAKFGQPEVGLGITPGYGGTQLLPRMIGEKNAKYLIFGGEIIGADEAYRLGLVQKIYPVDELMDKAVEFAKLIIKKSQVAVRMSKVAINNGLDMDLKSGIGFEAEAYVSAFVSDDRKEGMTAFVEKRDPSFKCK